MASHVELLPPDAERVEWLAARREGIGSSDIAAIMGQSSWASPYSVWCDKLGLTPLDAKDNVSDAMRWGTDLEPVIAAWWSRTTGISASRVGLCRNLDRPWQQATPDRLCGCLTPGVVETKSDRGFNHEEWDEQIPLKYLCQVLWQMDVIGADHGHLVASLAGAPPVTYEITLGDDEQAIIAELRHSALEFWQKVETRTRPSIDASDATTAALRSRYATAKPGEQIILHPRWFAALDDRCALKARAAESFALAKQIDNELVDAMGEATEAVAGGQLVATRRPRKDGVRVLNIIDPDKRKDVQA